MPRQIHADQGQITDGSGPRNLTAGLGFIAGAFLATIMSPLAQADSISGIEDLLPAPATAAASAEESMGGASVDFSDLTEANDAIHNFDGDFLQAITSQAEYGPVINDSLTIIGDFENAVSEVESGADIGIGIAGLVPGA